MGISLGVEVAREGSHVEDGGANESVKVDDGERVEGFNEIVEDGVGGALATRVASWRVKKSEEVVQQWWKRWRRQQYGDKQPRLSPSNTQAKSFDHSSVIDGLSIINKNYPNHVPFQTQNLDFWSLKRWRRPSW